MDRLKRKTIYLWRITKKIWQLFFNM
jgi:hypothetical protein